MTMKTPDLAVRSKLDSSSWLLTGATGFLGSVLIEQLFRTCNPSKIVLVVLPKKGADPLEQVEKLLSRPLYNKVREQYGSTAALLARIEVIEQDLSADVDLKLPAVDVIVHAAASISFNNHIHDAINANFRATQKMAEAAVQMPGLKSFVHVSTCYVNGNLPRGTRVPERVFPLLLEGKPVDYLATVKELMALPREPAEEQAVAYRSLWGFPNNYAMTKRLTEHLLLDAHAGGLPVRIVRPSIVGGTSLHHVMPGYIGNAGGSTAFALGIAFGMWACTEWEPEHVTDLIPADYVTSSILLAAAADAEQGAAVPLILQSATSGLDPMPNWQFYGAVTRMERAHPAPFKVFSGYPKPSMSSIYCKSTKKYESGLRRNDRSIKLKSLGMRLAGHKAAAAAMVTRWKVFKVVSCTAMDFDLYFDNSSVKALRSALAPEEQALFPCVWAKGVDEWDAYLDAYMAAVWERYVTKAGQRAPSKKKLPVTELACATLLVFALILMATRVAPPSTEKLTGLLLDPATATGLLQQ